MAKQNSFYQQFMRDQTKVKDYVDIEIKGYPTILMKTPGVIDIKESGVLKGKMDDIELYIVEYMIKNLFEKKEDGTQGENIFTAGNRDTLMAKWGELHTQVFAKFSEFITDSVGNEQKA